MTNPTSELASFIIDLEDEECPNFALHLAAYQVDPVQDFFVQVGHEKYMVETYIFILLIKVTFFRKSDSFFKSPK